MKHYSEQFVGRYRNVMLGVLAIFTLWIFFELGFSVGALVGFVVYVIGVRTGSVVAHHFGHNHSHDGDSVIDLLPVAVVLFANIAHPAIDGFSFVQTVHIGGAVIGLIYGGSIVLHEIVRQSAIIEGLRLVRIRPWVVITTALFGISIGILLGIFESKVLERYELVADLITLFSYGFVMSELYQVNTHEHTSRTKSFYYAFFGALVAGIILFLTKWYGR